MKVAIIGAGINGLSSGYQLLCSQPHLDVTIIAEKFTPNTTSDGAAGLWTPFFGGEGQQDTITGWSKATYDYILKEVMNDSSAASRGMYIGHITQIFDDDTVEPPWWLKAVDNFHILSKDEMNRFPVEVKYGFSYTCPFVEGRKYLPWLTKEFHERGGVIAKRKINDLGELAGKFDIVVNCTGMGSRDLVTDMTSRPIRGQVMRVYAPWVKTCFFYEQKKNKTVSYILPNEDSVVIGGTAYKDDFNLQVEDSDRKHILEGTQKLLPSLKHAPILEEWVGLRPGRASIRLEREDVSFSGITNSLKVVHNYGHAGMGLTTFWGCAADVVALVIECLNEANPPNAKL